MNYKFQYKQITNGYNFGGSRPLSAVKFLVLHWTANTARGANAYAHFKYFQNNRAGASAHYFVDDKEVIQIVGDSRIAYAVGGNQGYGVALNGATNYNSLSVEMCVNSDSDLDKMYANTVELFKDLKKKFPNARVCRHWDATRKDCPHGYTGRNNARWNKFLRDITSTRPANGWERNGNKWQYYKNAKLYAGWVQDKGKWYWVDPKDYYMTVGWKEIRGKWYYFKENGEMTKGWLKYNSHWFYFDRNGVMVTGEQTIDGKRYMFNKDGYLVK